MLFNSLTYAVFLPLVFIIYWIIPSKYRWGILFIASYYFYMSWNPKYVVLILGTTVISYVSAILLEKAKTKERKKLIVAVAAIICLGTLFIFKYFNFVMESVSSILSVFTIKLSPITLKLLLPVGISFYTFQTLSYVIDVYRGNVKAEKHFGYYATFISFFPQLVAGPIERTSNLLPQIKSEKKFEESKALDGIKLMLWGYFKKMVIADMVGIYVNTVYENIGAYTGFTFVIVAFLFTIQIYCDFSGYSSIAIGSAKLLGIDLMDNFKSPYFSTSVKEFWSRWHISLSTWFKDYVYIPLGGNRCSKLRHCMNLLITFMVSGIWHGANWTFVVWGTIHGLAQILENLFSKGISKIKKLKIGRFISWLVVFAFCNLAWVFFRADSLSEAIQVIVNMPQGILSPITYLRQGFNELGITVLRLCYIGTMISILAVVDFLNYKGQLLLKLNTKKKWMQWGVYLTLALIVILFAQKGAATEFVYFQF